MTDIWTRLDERTKRVLPGNWREGLKCPECGADANRPKCMWDMGGSCPRHDPDNYDPSPYRDVPDPECVEAAARGRELEAQLVTVCQREADTIRRYDDKLDKLEAERDALKDRVAELEAAKWETRHTSTANDLVQMGMARDAAISERDALKAALDEQIQHTTNALGSAFEKGEEIQRLKAEVELKNQLLDRIIKRATVQDYERGNAEHLEFNLGKILAWAQEARALPIKETNDAS